MFNYLKIFNELSRRASSLSLISILIMQAAFQIFQMQQFMYLQRSLMRHNPYLLKINFVIKQTNLNNIAIGALLNIMMAKNGLIFKKSEDYLYFKMKS